MSSKKTHHPTDEPLPEIPAEESGPAGTGSGPAGAASEMTEDETTPEISMDEAEVLKKQLEEARAQAAEYKDGWQRAVAEFSNYRKRLDRQHDDVYQDAVASIVKRYLPVLDDMERALAARPADLAWVDGIELIYRKLQDILKSEGIQSIEAEGHMFDPNFHEAISQEPSAGHQSGQIISVVRNGYMLGGKVIRPAMVRVAQ